jgi:hypothetical protein
LDDFYSREKLAGSKAELAKWSSFAAIWRTVPPTRMQLHARSCVT